MRLATVQIDGRPTLVGRADHAIIDLGKVAPTLPRTLLDLLGAGADAIAAAKRAIATAPASAVVEMASVTWLPTIPRPGKIICVGLNYRDHSAESGFSQPVYPTLFARFASSLVGHEAAIVRPLASEQLDYEGEFAAVIGQGGRHIAHADALSHVAGYTLFNDASIRDYQTKAPQWTVGKNFDGTGAFGPEFVSADELPPGLAGMELTTRLNGQVVQRASTNDLVFSVADLVATISEAITLEPGDVIVTGTPAGVGLARKPPLWMRAGDRVEVEVVGLGILANPIVDEVSASTATVAPSASPTA